MKCIIVIPAFNADNTIASLVEQIQKTTTIPIMIIDDGSNIPVSNYISDSNVIIHRIEKNMGKGYAIRTGLRYSQSSGYSHVVTLDADLQHPVKYIPKLLAVKDGVDLVIGVRHFDVMMPVNRRISNTLTSLILSCLCHRKFRDSQCGYRRYRIGTLNGLILEEDGFMFESEVIVKMFKNKQGQLVEIPIETVYNNEKSHIRNVYDTVQFIQLMIKSILK